MEKENNTIHLAQYINNQRELTPSETGLSRKFKKVPDTNLIKRGIAFCVDIFTIIVLKTVIDSGYILFVSQFLSPLAQDVQGTLTQTTIFMQLSIFLTLYCSYFLYCTYVLEGKTLGKMTMKLTIISEDFIYNHNDYSHKMTFNQALKRSLGYLLCYMSMGTFFIFNFSSEDKRGLSDFLSGSRTVSDDWLNHMLDYKKNSLEELRIDVDSLERAA